MCGCAPDRADDGTQLVTRWRRLAHVRGETRPAINISLVVVPPAPSPVPRVGVEDGDAPGHRARERTISIIAYRSIACHLARQRSRGKSVSLASFSTSGPIRFRILLNILIT